MSFIRKSSGGAKKKQTVDKTSFKEKISSSEERKQNVSDIGERSSGVAKETVYQVGVESIKEKVSSSEVRKQNIPSATRKISCGADKDTVLQVEMTSTKKEVSSPEERKLNVVSATEKNSSGVAKDKLSQVNVASQKEIVLSPEEREPSVLSTMKKNSSGVDKDTVLQADVASTKEEVPSLEEVKRNVPSSMGKSAPDLRKDTVFEIGTVSNKEEVPFLEEIKRNVISLTEKSAPDLGKDTIFQTDDVASTKEEVPSPEEIKRNILSAMGESFSDIAKDTAVEVDVASTKEKVPSPEEIKRNVTSAMRESFSQENVLTVEKEDTSSPGKEVASPVHEEKASMEKSDSPTNEASMTSDETKNYEEITSEYETISMPKVQSLNDDDVSTKENTVADDSDSDVFEIQLEDNVVVERTSVEEEKKMPEVANKRLEMKKPRKTLVADILKESCASQESIIVLDRNADSMVVTSDSNDRVQQPKERDILGSLEEKIDNISMAINRISERFKAQQEENAKWEESLQNLPIHIPDFSKLDWKIPSFTEVAEEAGQQAASAVVESAEALVTSMETQRSGCGSDIIIESLVNLVISEPFRENLSSSIAGSLKETLTECMSELVTSRYLPIFNKAHQEMTQQLNESIKRTFAEHEYTSDHSELSSTRESVIESSNTDDDKDNMFREDLKKWALDFNISHHALKSLSGIVNKRLPNIVPNDPRTLLRTNEINLIFFSVGTGKYWHNGLSLQLQETLEHIDDVPNIISLVFNIDGLPLYKSSRHQVWPILCQIYEKRHLSPIVVGIYEGTGKPNDLDAYLTHLVTELKDLLQNPMEIKTKKGLQKICTIKIKAFICDSPARALIKVNKRVASHKVPAKTFKRKLNVSFSKDVHASSSTYSPQSPETSRIGADSNQIVEDISNTMKQILEKEFAEWRKNVVESLSSTNLSTQETDTQTYEEIPPDRMPNSPPQPAHPSRPLMDQLMRAAEINSMINSGDINGAFEKALSESDLALVMTACRAANPEVVFAQPTPLKQHVLLSLIQQLATDMVHETQLKCRYLEEALIHLDNENPMIQKHLFTVAEQVKTNISAFLNLYPGHMCGRKLRLIMMAADSFITQPSTDEA